MPRLSQTRAYVALVLIVTLWGTFPATTKLAFTAFSPTFVTALRLIIGATFLGLVLARGTDEMTRGYTVTALKPFVLLAIMGFLVSTQITYVGIYFTTAANAALLQAAAPVMVALTARLYLGERLRRPQVAGFVVAAGGVLCVVTSGRLWTLRPSDLRLGDFLTILALVGWSGYTVYGKRVLASHSPAFATTAAYGFAALMMVPIAALTAPLFPPPRFTSSLAWAVVLYHALFGAMAHIWWYRAVQVVGPSRAAVFMNLTPIVGIALAATLLGEQIGLWQLVGGALVLVGVALTTRGQPREAATPRRAIISAS